MATSAQNINTTPDEEPGTIPIALATDVKENSARESHDVEVATETPARNDGSEGLTMMDPMEVSQPAIEFSMTTETENVERSDDTPASTGVYAMAGTMDVTDHQEQQPMNTSNPPYAVMDPSTSEIVESQEQGENELSSPRKRTYEDIQLQNYDAENAAVIGAALTMEGSHTFPHDQTFAASAVAAPSMHEDNSEQNTSKRCKTSESDLHFLDTSSGAGPGNAYANPASPQQVHAPSPTPPSMAGQQSKKVNNEQWDAMFKKLVEYKELHGDCLVPKRYARDPRLGTWVETRKLFYMQWSPVY